ncbi:hypothetical protein ACFWOG_20515 [Kitasatospora sp. NPDC058406]|uniref:hypothetical protein n=1 Tax=Kitasatospora sp. NPDC058406 TaxID=3346483 RepID=UPI003664BAD4
MDTETMIALASAAIGGGTGAIAFWQARIARRQARIAQETADLAQRQANAAEQQAKAAEDQVALMLRQLDAEDAERREARGPAFETKHRHRIDGAPARWCVTRFELTQTAGPALAEVTVTVAGNGVFGIWAGGEALASAYTQPGPVSTGFTITVDVAVDPTSTDKTPVLFTLECRAQEGADNWRRSQTSHVPAYSRISSPARRSFR